MRAVEFSVLLCELGQKGALKACVSAAFRTGVGVFPNPPEPVPNLPHCSSPHPASATRHACICSSKDNPLQFWRCGGLSASAAAARRDRSPPRQPSGRSGLPAADPPTHRPAAHAAQVPSGQNTCMGTHK